MNRLLFVGLTTILTVLTTACGLGGTFHPTETKTVYITPRPITTSSSVSVAKPPPLLPTGITPKPMRAIIVQPSPVMVGDLVDNEGQIRCQEGLESIELVAKAASTAFGFDNWNIIVNMSSDRTAGYQEMRYSPSDNMPLVRGAYVVTLDSFFLPLGKEYPIAWEPGMEESFVIQNSAFDDNTLVGIVLCI